MYSSAYAISIQTQLSFSIIILHSINESMKHDRYAELKYSLYDLIQISAQLFGDLLTIPYHLLFSLYETPYIYFQSTTHNNALIDHLQPLISQFAPTIYLKNALIQFLVICLDETPISWFFQQSKYHIKRECITLNDEGLIALDWWVKPCSIPTTKSHHIDPEHTKSCTYSDKSNHVYYTSKIYYQYTHALYNQCFEDQSLYPNGDRTPILLVFPTFAGDSVSAPTRIVCNYFVQRNWRVIVYVKRGCGSFTKSEFLPLTTLKPFCLQGESDYEVIIDLVQNRFPCAPKMLMGLSGGGAYIQNILGDDKYKQMFCGGVKIDAGMEYASECCDLDQRQPFIANILGQFFEVAMMRCRENKLKHNILQEDPHYDKYNWDTILNYRYYNEGLKGLQWCMRHFVSPCYGFGTDLHGYLEWANPRDLKHLNHPFLILDTWNDFLKNTDESVKYAFEKFRQEFVLLAENVKAVKMERLSKPIQQFLYTSQRKYEFP
eukprot:61616_1